MKKPATSKPRTETFRINIDFPVNILAAIDAEADRVGVPRQSWIKMQLAKLFDEKGASA